MMFFITSGTKERTCHHKAVAEKGQNQNLCGFPEIKGPGCTEVTSRNRMVL